MHFVLETLFIFLVVLGVLTLVRYLAGLWTFSTWSSVSEKLESFDDLKEIEVTIIWSVVLSFLVVAVSRLF